MDMQELACIFLRERSWSEKPTHCGIPSIWPSGKGKSMGANEKIGGCPGWPGGEVNRQITEVMKSVLGMRLQGWVPAVTHSSRPTGCTQWGGDLRQAVDSA